jgi:hypothetical protein
VRIQTAQHSGGGGGMVRSSLALSPAEIFLIVDQDQELDIQQKKGVVIK